VPRGTTAAAERPFLPLRPQPLQREREREREKEQALMQAKEMVMVRRGLLQVRDSVGEQKRETEEKA
jgi:hypothetical protein